MVETLVDDFLNGTKGHFYRPKNSTEIIKILEVGSQCCTAEVYDSNGRLLLKRTTIHTDHSQHYFRIPEDSLPDSLRQKESLLDQATESRFSDSFHPQDEGKPIPED